MKDIDLEIPHPRMHERSFVLIPLAEIDPEARHPILDRTAGQLLTDLVAHKTCTDSLLQNTHGGH